MDVKNIGLTTGVLSLTSGFLIAINERNVFVILSAGLIAGILTEYVRNEYLSYNACEQCRMVSRSLEKFEPLDSLKKRK